VQVWQLFAVWVRCGWASRSHYGPHVPTSHNGGTSVQRLFRRSGCPVEVWTTIRGCLNATPLRAETGQRRKSNDARLCLWLQQVPPPAQDPAKPNETPENAKKECTFPHTFVQPPPSRNIFWSLGGQNNQCSLWLDVTCEVCRCASTKSSERRSAKPLLQDKITRGRYAGGTQT